jgi:hypothetical protein
MPNGRLIAVSEQGTEKTNPLHGLERDGTGTGVWTHPAAETMLPKQPERCECECGACWWDGKDWLVRSCVETRDMSVCGEHAVQHCPGECGCRLSVVDGEPRVGEKYAVLERDARRFRAVAGAVGPMLNVPHDENRWHFETDGVRMRYETLGEYADALGGEADGE